MSKRQKGFSLLEILIVAGLLAAGLAALFFMVNRYNVRAAANNEAQVLNTMAAETRALFRSQGNYNGVTPAVLIANGIVPTTHVSGTSIETGWGTTVSVFPDNLQAGAGVGNAVTFVYTVPREACSRFIRAAEGPFSRIRLDAHYVKHPAGLYSLETVGVGLLCNPALGGSVTIRFCLGLGR